MEFEEFLEKVFYATDYTEGLKYDLAVLWLHPEYLPVGVVSLGDNVGSIIKIPSAHTNAWGKNVPVIAITSKLFAGQSHITDIILPSRLGRIPRGAFAGCSSLKRITIPRGIRKILRGTFEGCDSLEDVYFEGTEEEWNKIDIVYEGSRIVDPKKLGLYVEVQHFPIPGNEPLLNARIHFNCGEREQVNASEFSIRIGSSDVTSLFRRI